MEQGHLVEIAHRVGSVDPGRADTFQSGVDSPLYITSPSHDPEGVVGVSPYGLLLRAREGNIVGMNAGSKDSSGGDPTASNEIVLPQRGLVVRRIQDATRRSWGQIGVSVENSGRNPITVCQGAIVRKVEDTILKEVELDRTAGLGSSPVVLKIRRGGFAHIKTAYDRPVISIRNLAGKIQFGRTGAVQTELTEPRFKFALMSDGRVIPYRASKTDDADGMLIFSLVSLTEGEAEIQLLDTGRREGTKVHLPID